MTQRGGTGGTAKRRKSRSPASIRLTQDQVEEIASDAAEKALSRLLLSLGIDTSSPEGILNAQRDFQHVRSWRQSSETVKRQGLMSAIGVLTVGVIALVWQKIGNPSSP